MANILSQDEIDNLLELEDETELDELEEILEPKRLYKRNYADGRVTEIVVLRRVEYFHIKNKAIQIVIFSPVDDAEYFTVARADAFLDKYTTLPDWLEILKEGE